MTEDRPLVRFFLKNIYKKEGFFNIVAVLLILLKKNNFIYFTEEVSNQRAE